MSFRITRTPSNGQSLRALIADAVIARKQLLAQLSKQNSEEGSQEEDAKSSTRLEDVSTASSRKAESPLPSRALLPASFPSSSSWHETGESAVVRTLPPVVPRPEDAAEIAAPALDSSALFSLRAALRTEQETSGKLQSELEALRSLVMQERVARESLDRRLEELSSNLPSILSSSLVWASPGNNSTQASTLQAATPASAVDSCIAERHELSVEKQEALMKRYIVSKLNARCQRKTVVSVFRLWFTQTSTARLHSVLESNLSAWFMRRRKLAILRAWFWTVRKETQAANYFVNFTTRTARETLREAFHCWRMRRLAELVERVSASLSDAEAKLAGQSEQPLAAAHPRSPVALAMDGESSGAQQREVLVSDVELNGRHDGATQAVTHCHDSSSQAVAAVSHGSAQAVAESCNGFAQTSPDVAQIGQQTTPDVAQAEQQTTPNVMTIAAQTTPHVANGVAQTAPHVGHEVAVGNDDAPGGADDHHSAVLGPAPAPSADMMGAAPAGEASRRAEVCPELEGNLRETLERLQRVAAREGADGELLLEVERGLVEAVEQAAAKECELQEARQAAEEVLTNKDEVAAMLDAREAQLQLRQEEVEQLQELLRGSQAQLQDLQQQRELALPQEAAKPRTPFKLFDDDDDDDGANAPSAAAPQHPSPAVRRRDREEPEAAAGARGLTVGVLAGAREEAEGKYARLDTSSIADLCEALAEVRASQDLVAETRSSVEQDARAVAASITHLEDGWRAAQQELQVVREFIDTERRQLEKELEATRGAAAEQHAQLLAQHRSEREQLHEELAQLERELEAQTAHLKQLEAAEQEREQQLLLQSRKMLAEAEVAAEASSALAQVEAQMATIEASMLVLRGQVDKLQGQLVEKEAKVVELDAKLESRTVQLELRKPRGGFQLFDDEDDQLMPAPAAPQQRPSAEAEGVEAEGAEETPLSAMQSREQLLTERAEELRLLEQHECALELERSKAQQLEADNAVLLQSVQETESLLEQATEKLQLLVQDKGELLAELQHVQEDSSSATLKCAELEETVERLTGQLNQKLGQERGDLLAEVERAQEEQAEMALTRARLEEANAEMADKCVRLEEANAEMVDKCVRLEATVEGLEARVQESSEEQRLAMEEHQEDLNKARDALVQAEMAALRAGSLDEKTVLRELVAARRELEIIKSGGDQGEQHGADRGEVRDRRASQPEYALPSPEEVARMQQEIATLLDKSAADREEMEQLLLLQKQSGRREEELTAQVEALRQQLAGRRGPQTENGANGGLSSDSEAGGSRAGSEEASSSGDSESEMELGAALEKEREAHRKLLEQNKELVKKVREWKLRNKDTSQHLTGAKGEIASLAGKLAGEQCESRGLREELQALKKVLEETERAGVAGLNRATSIDSVASAQQETQDVQEWTDIDLDLVREVLMRGDAEELEEQLELAVGEIKGRRSAGSIARMSMEPPAGSRRASEAVETATRTAAEGGGSGRSAGAWAELEERCEEAQREAQRLEREAREHSARAEALGQELDASEGRVRDLERELEAKEGQLRELRAEAAKRPLTRQLSRGSSVTSDSEWEGDSEDGKRQEAAVLAVLADIVSMIVEVIAAAGELRIEMREAADEALESRLKLQQAAAASGAAAGRPAAEEKKVQELEGELDGLREVYHQTMQKMVEEKRGRETADAMVVRLEARLSKKSTAKQVHDAEEKYEASQQEVRALEVKVQELEEAHELTLAAMKESLEVTTGMLEETQRELSEYKDRA